MQASGLVNAVGVGFMGSALQVGIGFTKDDKEVRHRGANRAAR